MYILKSHLIIDSIPIHVFLELFKLRGDTLILQLAMNDQLTQTKVQANKPRIVFKFYSND